jgi:hypothetical protein
MTLKVTLDKLESDILGIQSRVQDAREELEDTLPEDGDDQIEEQMDYLESCYNSLEEAISCIDYVRDSL